MLRFFAILPIKFYQHVISPRKGYRCAHSIKHGGTGCSGAVIKIIETTSIFQWRSLIKKRFADCKQAHEDLKKDRKGRCDKCKPSSVCEAGCNIGDAFDCDCGDIGSC